VIVGWRSKCTAEIKNAAGGNTLTMGVLVSGCFELDLSSRGHGPDKVNQRKQYAKSTRRRVLKGEQEKGEFVVGGGEKEVV